MSLISTSKVIQKIDKKLESILDDKLQILKKVKEYVVQTGGKRLRPLLHFYLARLQGYDGDEWLKIAAIGELIHTASLLHDDVLDDATLRRNKPTFKILYGNKTSILSGDYLLARAMSELSTMKENLGIILLPLFSRVIHLLSLGEILQDSAIGNINLQIKSYEKIINWKTSVLFGCMSETSYILTSNGGVDKKKQNEYRIFGENLGKLFQLRDDYLDYFSLNSNTNSNKNEKEKFMDLKKGLVTYPLIILLSKIKNKEKKDVFAILKNELDRSSIIGINFINDLFKKYDIKNLIITALNKEIISLINFISSHKIDNYKEVLCNQIDKLILS